MMMKCLFLTCLTAVTCTPTIKTPSVSAGAPNDGTASITWALTKYYLSEQDSSNEGKKKFILFKNADLGPFGASKVILGINSDSAFEGMKAKSSISFDNTNSSVDLRMSEERLIEEEHVVTFDIASPDGVHDVYISIPSEFNVLDFNWVQFRTAEPAPGQLYYLAVKASARILTAFAEDKYATTYVLHGWPAQKFKLDRDCDGTGYKIVTSFEKHVLAINNASKANQEAIVIEPFAHKPHQLWSFEEFDGGFRFRSTLFSSKCIDLSNGRNADGARIVSHACNGTPAQTFYVTKA